MKKLSSKTSLILIISVFVAILCLVVFLVAIGYRDDNKWFDDYETAREYAIKAKKDIFLVFEGSSWDDTSSQLKHDILDTDEFLRFICKHYVPVCLDIPLDDGETDFSEQQNKNLELSRIFAIPEVPTILVMTVNNQIYETIPCNQGGATLLDMESSITDAYKKSGTIASLNNKLENVSGPDKVLVIDELVSMTPQDYIFQFYNLINTVPELDPQNKTGLVGKYTLILTHVASLEKLFNGDAAGAAEVYADAAQNPLLTASEKLEAYYKAATMCYYGGLNDKLKEYLANAIDADPDSENASILRTTLDNFIAEEQAAGAELSEQVQK